MRNDPILQDGAASLTIKAEVEHGNDSKKPLQNQPSTAHKESADDYKREIYRSGKWRAIVCRDGIQWVIQRAKKSGPTLAWRGVSYCTTKAALIRCWAEKTKLPVPTRLDTLPDRMQRCA